MNFERDYNETRQATCTLLEMVDAGMVDARSALQNALAWMDDCDVERMAFANEYFYVADDDEKEF